MLGFFPRPGEDELLYSVVARYGAMIGNGTGGPLIQDFFGTAVGIAAIDLPRHIDRLVARIPLGTAWGRDRLIDGHTLFPYQLRFAPPAVAAAVRGYMAGGEGRRPARLGVMSAAFPTRGRLMLCPACAREDAVASGNANWRRVHQLPGVLVCPRHGCALHESDVPRIERRGRGAFVPLTKEARRAARPLAIARGARAALQRFASGSEALLRPWITPCDTTALQDRLRGLLSGYRWNRAPSLLHIEALVGEFRRHPGVRTLMSALDLAWTDGQVATALNRLLYREAAAKHPLMVLMVLELAGASVADLDGAGIVVPPARQPLPGRIRATVRHDLPCGNPACGRFAGCVGGAGAGNTPVRAECGTCGYVYALDARRPGGVCTLVTGPLWDALLARTLAGGTGVREAGRALAVAPTTVMRHARRLGLWREEWKDRPKLRLRRETLPGRLLDKHRAGWLAFRASGMDVPAKGMPRAAFNAYRYLIRKDRGWLEGNCPLSR